MCSKVTVNRFLNCCELNGNEYLHKRSCNKYTQQTQ